MQEDPPPSPLAPSGVFEVASPIHHVRPIVFPTKLLIILDELEVCIILTYIIIFYEIRRKCSGCSESEPRRVCATPADLTVDELTVFVRT